MKTCFSLVQHDTFFVRPHVDKERSRNRKHDSLADGEKHIWLERPQNQVETAEVFKKLV